MLVVEGGVRTYGSMAICPYGFRVGGNQGVRVQITLEGLWADTRFVLPHVDVRLGIYELTDR